MELSFLKKNDIPLNGQDVPIETYFFVAKQKQITVVLLKCVLDFRKSPLDIGKSYEKISAKRLY